VADITSIGPYRPLIHPDAGAYLAGQRNPDQPTRTEFDCISRFLSALRVSAQSVVGYSTPDGMVEVIGLSQCGHVIEFSNKGALIEVVRRGYYP
jgi:hypothetical protein